MFESKHKKYYCDSDIRNLRQTISNNDLQASFACRTMMESLWRLEEGQSQTKVARWLNVSPSVVQKLWRRFQTTDSASRKFSQGRPTAIASADNRYLTLYEHPGIEPLLRLFLDPLLLQLPEGCCQRQPCVEDFTKVVCIRGD